MPPFRTSSPRTPKKAKRKHKSRHKRRHRNDNHVEGAVQENDNNSRSCSRKLSTPGEHNAARSRQRTDTRKRKNSRRSMSQSPKRRREARSRHRRSSQSSEGSPSQHRARSRGARRDGKREHLRRRSPEPRRSATPPQPEQPANARSNPLYTEEEEQEVVIIVDSLEEADDAGDLPAPCAPRRAPSTSSGYGSGGGSHGRVSPSLPKTETDLPVSKHEGSQSTSDSDSPECTLSRSLKDDIRACLGGCRWEKDVGDVVEAAVKGAGGITAARARLHAALLALHDPPRIPNRGPSLPYCGPGVRPGDVTMMAKTTEMSLLAASALFTLDSARGKALSKSLARGERRRRRCRAVLAILALLLLLAAVGAVELLLSRGQRMFGVMLR